MDKLNECLDKVSEAVLSFLIKNGAYSNGYYSYASGTVTIKDEGTVHWDTPTAKEELTDKGKEKRGKELYKEIQAILKECNVDEIVIRSKDEGYGGMTTEVVYVQETKKSVPMWSIK